MELLYQYRVDRDVPHYNYVWSDRKKLPKDHPIRQDRIVADRVKRDLLSKDKWENKPGKVVLIEIKIVLARYQHEKDVWLQTIYHFLQKLRMKQSDLSRL